jgi:hypothetical protein
MHRTTRQAIQPVRRSYAAQQRNFDAFQHEFNHERPHERLGQETPASQYRPSPRAYPERLPPLEYPAHFIVKKITTGGTFRFHNRLLYLANAMVDQHIGLEETDDGIWTIYFNSILLATFDERDYIITGYCQVLPMLPDSCVTHHPGSSGGDHGTSAHAKLCTTTNEPT